jgi:hypothetical protein
MNPGQMVAYLFLLEDIFLKCKIPFQIKQTIKECSFAIFCEI